MSIFQAVLLGIVQGLTEFLPVSSSGHLNIIPWFFGWTTIPESFDVALHAGTLLALLIYFFKDWIQLLKGAYLSVFKKEKNIDGKIFWYLVMATIPSGLIGYLLDKYFEEILTKPIVIAISLIVMGIILYFVDKIAKSDVDLEHMSLKQAIVIGMSQILAFIPGVSRSGITITTARAFKLNRESAARYSFYLSAPIVFAATVLKVSEFEYTLAFGLGVLTSFLVGLLVISIMMKYLKKGSYMPFAIYRVIFGCVIIAKLIMMIK